MCLASFRADILEASWSKIQHFMILSWLKRRCTMSTIRCVLVPKVWRHLSRKWITRLSRSFSFTFIVSVFLHHFVLGFTTILQYLNRMFASGPMAGFAELSRCDFTPSRGKLQIRERKSPKTRLFASFESSAFFASGFPYSGDCFLCHAYASLHLQLEIK